MPLFVHIHVHIQSYTHTYIYIYTYTYIEREGLFYKLFIINVYICVYIYLYICLFSWFYLSVCACLLFAQRLLCVSVCRVYRCLE